MLELGKDQCECSRKAEDEMKRTSKCQNMEGLVGHYYSSDFYSKDKRNSLDYFKKSSVT